MISKIIKKFTGSHYRRYLKKQAPKVVRINEIEEEYQQLSDDEIRSKTDEFKQRYADGESLDDLLPEAYAAVKNSTRRIFGQPISYAGIEGTWDMIPFDVQLIGGIALHDNKITEMATGEGKTLVATLPLYLNALTGRNCQLVTVNDYLARRDAEWMGNVYRSLGLTVGYIQNSMSPAERKAVYGCDITYGTASEFGFDYLRDNGMASRKEDQVQRDHYFCIVDEVDQVLVDEARTPLIISGPAQIEREMPFLEMKETVARLVRQQSSLCNRLITQARKESTRDSVGEEEGQQASDAGDGRDGTPGSDLPDVDSFRLMLQVKLGSPKHKQLLRMLEDGKIRKPFDKFELEMSGDYNRTQHFEMKEELFYVIDEKGHQADLTEKGRRFLRPKNDDAFVLPDLPSIYIEIDRDNGVSDEEKDRRKAEAQEQFEKTSEDIHCISQLLRAFSLYDRDDEYIVRDGKVMIVDEHTGRVMPGRRWSDGLHQAIEAKEGVAIEKETRTYATITIQNYFRLYDKRAGMTGTAETEANEFRDIYKLDVMVVPTNRPVRRQDQDDVIYKTRREKYNAVIREIQEAQQRGQPVLVGTVSVEASEVLSRMLKRTNIVHSVLNAKFHAQEAEIITRAGQPGSVTIATNMAGRGTDIKLGEKVAESGGLYVIGTERHTARRIDRQLRGRGGRQGDPGESRFFVSLEDDLLRLFGNSGAVGKLLEKSVGEGDVPLPSWVIENAQKRVEEQHYSVRKRLLQYDDVFNRQREVIYNLRNDAIHSDTPKEIIFELIEEEIDSRMEEVGMLDRRGFGPEVRENFLHWVNTYFPVVFKVEDTNEVDAENLPAFILERIEAAYAMKESVENADSLRALERYVIINSMDRHWQDHLTEMDDLRQSVGLRGYGQKDPLSEFKSEAFGFFEEMMKSIRADICKGIFRSATNITAFENMLALLSRDARTQGPESDGKGALSAAPGHRAAAEVKLPKVTVRREGPKVGRNAPCPCGSGKKYKKCCGRRG